MKRKKQKQSEILASLTGKELAYNVVINQFFFLFIASIYFYIFFSWESFSGLFQFDPWQIFLYGIIPATGVVIIDILLIRLVPKKHWDDGGLNEKLFKSLNFWQIFIIATLIGISEEMLFRGVIHTEFGYIIASVVFALMHFRYLSKIVLLVSVFLLSFLIGYMYELTFNLLVPITAHIWIDFLLGLYYRYRMR